MRTKWSAFFLALVLLLAPTAWAVRASAGDALYQYATIDALLAGVYDGNLTMDRLLTHGDFGLGTLNGLDGELVVLDGVAYHAAAGGQTDIPAGAAMTPFACVTHFTPGIVLALPAIHGLDALNAAVTARLPSKNRFYAIRIDAAFDRVRTRAIPRQTPPYAPLAEVTKQQVITDFSGPGTLVGLYSPDFVKGINVPGFHWHFLTGDRTGGGHVLGCSFASTDAHLDEIRSFALDLPDSSDFDRLDLGGDRSRELKIVEQGTSKTE
ncbi:acetolactate decarboxylase [Desulfovibrio sp. Huiquan2017]|uniref:acetolactate decarboxylase n=1 Tax=Desulfovibrio sp. Huiquan2017 TaxID=2816861 RepID=UPI001A937304|nr:acetolactate decarboxylase [Desulfovibrio sp. Huiquan2017]